MRRRDLAGVLLVWVMLGAWGAASSFAAETVSLAEDGEARLPIVVAPEASEAVRATAEELAEQLGRITGGTFEIEQGDGSSGIAVGVYSDFPALGLADRFEPESIAGRETYLLHTHDNGAQLIGAGELAVQHAVWDLLHRLGHRQYFPTETWEIVPESPDLSVAVDVFEQPDYFNRMGPRGAPWTDRERWTIWRDRNRITSDFTLRTGHSYNGIIRRNRDAFDENPEYLALVDGERGGGRGDKFCISNDELRELVVQDAINRVDPDSDSISMDPSDGGDWCECEPCAEMGSVSDRVIILANEVAEAINELDHGEKYVGTYAYASHSPPPSVDVHPNVIVSIATSFIRGGFTLEELIEGWSERTEMIGIREYHDVHTWSRAMPRSARGGNVAYLIDRLPYFHEQGARFMNSEASDSWGANGLGFYLSARLLWDVSAADRVDALIEDFIDNSFGSAREPMREFYHLIAEDHDTMRTSEDLLARMYGQIHEARQLTDDPDVLTRLDELTLYTRYVELMFAFNAASDAAREEAAQDLFRHAYRMRDTMLVHIQALYRNLRRRGIEMPAEADPGRLAVGAPGEDYEQWRSSEPFTDEQIARFLEDGVANHERMDMPFEPASFSDELVPAAEALDLPAVDTGDFGRGDSFRGRHTMFTWLPSDDRALRLTVTAGQIWQDRGNPSFELYSPQEVTLDPVDTDASVPPDEEPREIVLNSPYDGLHRLEWTDGGDLTSLEWPEGHPMTMRSSMDDPTSLRGNRRLYFYVPKGTETVGGFTTHERTRILDSDGNRLLDWGDVEGGEGYFAIPVPEGQDGTLWKIERGYGTQMLMTVPPYLARNERELLLPREVVEADASD